MNRRLVLLLPYAVLLAGLAATALSTWWLHTRTQDEATAEFRRIVARGSDDIGERFRKPVYGLNGARGVYATHSEVRRSSFRRYVASRNLPVEFPGVRGFGFIQRVERADLPTFIAAERADDAPHFALRQLALKDEPDLFVIKFIEPAANNAGAAGLDIGSEAVRRQGALLALETTEATTTGMVTLVQDERRSAGVLLYVPVYADAPDGAAPGTRGALRGLLYAPIVIAELLANLGDVTAGKVHVEIFDTASGTVAGPKMFSSAETSSAPTNETLPRAARFEILRIIDVPGRLLTMRVRSTPAFEASYSSTNTWLLALGGVLASGLLAALIRQQGTGRSRAEAMAQAMTADLSRLALVARRATNAVVITDAQRRITWVNEGFERITGYSAAEAIGRSPGALLQFEATDAGTVQAMRKALDAGEGFRGDVQNRGKRGQTYWLSIDIQPLREADGTLTGFMSIQSDITERKAAERQARELTVDLSNQKFALDQHAIVSIADLQGTIVYVNQRFCDLSGYSQAELMGQNHRIVSSGVHEPAFFDELWRTISSGQVWHGQVCNRHKGGGHYWVDATVVPLMGVDGLPEKYIAIRTDITKNKAAEAALRASQALLSQTGRIGGVGGWEFDIATQALSWTDETCRIHDLPPGHRPTLEEAVDYYTPESRPVVERALAEAMASGQRWDLELPLVTATGRPIWVRAVGEAEFAHGKPVRLVGAFQDISERHAMNAVLAHKTAELKRSNEELERFAYITSHDLQEPLRMVTSYGQLLTRRHLADLKPEAQEFVGYMVDGGQRAQALIRDLLSLARLDSQAKPWTPVSLEATLADVLRSMRMRMQETGARVTHDPLPTVAGDAAQLGQLMANLVGNALKFCGKAAPVVHVGAVREGTGWRISVRDNGIGIEPRYFDRIFQMFQRLHLRTEYEGTGIGLAICKKVVERHGGHMGVESTPGQGATFFFTLPDHVPDAPVAPVGVAAIQGH